MSLLDLDIFHFTLAVVVSRRPMWKGDDGDGRQESHRSFRWPWGGRFPTTIRWFKIYASACVSSSVKECQIGWARIIKAAEVVMIKKCVWD